MRKHSITIEYVPIKEVVKYLPHEEINRREVDSIVRRFEKKAWMKPITVWNDIILDGHHRFNAVKYLYEHVRGWKSKSIPVCFVDGVEVDGATIEEVVDAANSGELMDYKTTYTTPRSPDTRFKIK